jgi:glucan phosphoethanolaminetransferase (alkaline phosphatase superfamily)
MMTKTHVPIMIYAKDKYKVKEFIKIKTKVKMMTKTHVPIMIYAKDKYKVKEFIDI